MLEAGGRPAQGKAGHHEGIASNLSFVSAVSFPGDNARSPRLSIKDKVGYLRGLKKNVTIGRLVPSYTGIEFNRQVKIAGEDVIEEPSATKGPAYST